MDDVVVLFELEGVCQVGDVVVNDSDLAVYCHRRTALNCAAG